MRGREGKGELFLTVTRFCSIPRLPGGGNEKLKEKAYKVAYIPLKFKISKYENILRVRADSKSTCLAPYVE